MNLPSKRPREPYAKQDNQNPENLDFDEKFDDDEED